MNHPVPKEMKCQYKTGKCEGPRALKRNGKLHSLCEEHRLKQNLIQRRSDRKYQSLHAQKRRQKSQEKAVMRKQLTLAMAQEVFFRHQMAPSYLNMNLMRSHSMPPPPMAYHQQHSPTGVSDLWNNAISDKLPQANSPISSASSSTDSDLDLESFLDDIDTVSTLDNMPLWDESTIDWQFNDDLALLQDIIPAN